ncbi:Maf family protein [Thermus brockianus]|uniref:dTTP/UTP pyrophosphatase n=1 Tax=Thermus brockianus TaxID=56956 RepID=A0ABN6NJR9_THEBO|nr:Maf family protein [Thermus brockianus]BDG16595.1 Maf-like protein [Thermus brockianus]
MGSGRPPLILASGSPRRRALLEALGYPLRVVVPGVEEEDLALPPPELALALARRKGESVAGEWVLAADTVVDLGGKVLGKPKDPEENRLFLRLLSGRSHRVHTAIYLRTPMDLVLEVHTAKVRFRPLSEEEIAWYVESGEGLDKAGGYGAQGLGMALLSGVEGDFYTVVGLPVSRVFALLWERGFRP